MLDAMRRGAVNWFAKILLGLLVIAFSVWGIGDVVRRIGHGTLASIGNSEITAEDFRTAYQEEMASITRRLGRRLTPDQAKLFGVEQRALSRLIGTAAIDNHAHQLRLAISDQGIAELIRNDPAFQGPNGAFSKVAFQSYLRQLGMSEGRYVSVRRKEEVRDQLTDTLLSGLAPPQWLIDQLHRYREETRVIEFMTPAFDKLIKVPEAEESKLKEYYEQNKRRFTTPEQRRVNVLLLTRDTAKSRIAVSEDEIKAAYEADKEKYNIPEKRRVQQLAFGDRAAAEKAYTDLVKAKDFKEAAAKLGFKDSDIELGLLSRADMIDNKVAEVAFALKKDELSKPVEGQFATVLVRITEIEPGKQRSLEEVKGEIRDRIAGERVTQEIQDLHEKIENERSAGKPLKEIADNLHLAFHEIAALERSGKGVGGVDQEDAGKVAEAAFNSSVGLDSEAAELGDGGYAWIDVLGVTPEKQKPYEEVAAEVKTDVVEQERLKEIAAYSGKIVDRLKAGETTFEALAKELGANVDKTKPLTRTATPPGLTQSAVLQAFALPKGGAGSAATADGKARTIIRVADVIPAPPATSEQTEHLKTELTRQLQGDILSEYVSGLQKRYGLTVNQELLKQALGTEREQPDFE